MPEHEHRDDVGLQEPARHSCQGLANALSVLASSRDAEAWHRLVTIIESDVRGVVSRLTGDSGLAADAFQETLLQLRDHAGQFAPPPSLDRDLSARRWVMRVAANTARMLMRSRRRTFAHEHAFGRQALRATVSDPLEPLIRDETAAQVRLALNGLSEANHAVVWMRYIAGFDMKEIAIDLGISTATAQKRLERGLGTIRDRLARTGLTLTVLVICDALRNLPALEFAPMASNTVSATLTFPRAASVDSIPGRRPFWPIIGYTLVAMAFALVLMISRGEKLGASTSNASPAGHSDSDATLEAKLAKQFTLSISGYDLREAADMLASVSALRIDIHPSVPPAVVSKTISVATIKGTMSMRTALERIVHEAGCRFEMHEGRIIILPVAP